MAEREQIRKTTTEKDDVEVDEAPATNEKG